MKAKELINYLKECVSMNPECECYINGNPVGVNADDIGNVDLYEVEE